MPKIIIEPLINAVKSLEEVLDMPIDDIVRDSTIQRFEYSFELSKKMIKRFLKVGFDEIDIEEQTYVEIMKKAAKHGLISNLEIWKKFRLARNYTSHAYSEEVAKASYEIAETFLPEVKNLIIKLEEINSRLNEEQ